MRAFLAECLLRTESCRLSCAVLGRSFAESLVKSTRPVLTVTVPESSLLTDLSSLLDIDISDEGLARLIRDECSGEAEGLGCLHGSVECSG